MSAFVNPEATEVIELAACYCPGALHPNDTVTIRAQYGYGDLIELASVHTNGRVDPMGERAKLLELAIKDWSFVDESGAPIPVGMPTILLLQSSIAQQLGARIDEVWDSARAELPNGSGGQSQPSSLASLTASPNRAQRRAARHSTSKS